jgi:NAD(P)-dependent dehydrogenase (short-subunit alcohol dehydrogenase family)
MTVHDRPQPSAAQKTAFVTGGCGFVGRHLVKRLWQAGYTIWLVDDLSTGKHPDEWLGAVEMSTQTQAADVAYRQDLAERLIREGVALSELDRDTAYYEQLEQSGRGGGSPVNAAQAAAVLQRLKAAAEAVQRSIERLVTLYDELSEQRLNPTSTLYSVATPFAVKTRFALTWSTAALSLALAALLALIAAPIACALHRSSTRRAALPGTS